MMYAAQYLKEASELFEQRNAVYKDTTGLCGEILALLKSECIMRLSSPADFQRHHILTLMVVKLVRYCNNWNDGGHKDSMRDLTVYAAMLESIDQELQLAELQRMVVGGPDVLLDKLQGGIK